MKKTRSVPQCEGLGSVPSTNYHEKKLLGKNYLATDMENILSKHSTKLLTRKK